ncbi:MAG: sigma-70 family RNA polymerase sigma factor [Psychromonas sp.]|nr:sigma-70 family RNA polymerase sigma factor [Psychromonas sp.]
MRTKLSNNMTLADNILNMTDIRDFSNNERQVDEWLKSVACNQDKIAFTKLFKSFAPKIRVHGLLRFKQEALAMELVQETMILVWRKAALYDPSKGKASTWIYTVMRNYCFDMLRKIQNKKEDTISEYLWPLFESDEREEETDHILSRTLFMQIERLPEQQKQVIEAIYLQQLTQQELANKMGLPLGTIKSRLRLAMAKLKSKLGEEHD